MANKPKTRYPIKLEQSYSKNISKLIDELNETTLYEFDKYLAADIDKGQIKIDSLFVHDGVFDIAKSILSRVKVFFVGIVQNRVAKKIVTKHINSVSGFSKANVNTQLSSRGINPIESEKWLKDYTQSKIAENVSYITSIRDDYTTKIEQIIYRGITNGQSSKEIRDELVKVSGLSKERAAFIARDQTGTILGQMNAQRHQRAGLIAFIWSDSGDERVRQSHHERNGKIYYYADDPLLPGTDYGCRCVAEPLDEEEIQEYIEKENNK